MPIRLLVTISDSPSSLLGVNFLGSFFSDKNRLRLYLCFTGQTPPTASAFEQTRSILRQQGFRDEWLDSLEPECCSPLGNAIQEQADKGSCDAIILGKRGLSWLEGMMDKSASVDLLHTSHCRPFWICRPVRPGQKNVLLCLDGSNQCSRMIEHVGEVLSEERQHRLTLLHVSQPMEADPLQEDAMFDTAWSILLDKGVHPSRIRARTMEHSDTVRAVIQHATAGNYAAVAVGRKRSGGEPDGLKRFFMGSVAIGLFREMREHSLWVCQ